MASVYYGLNRGQPIESVKIGTATNSTDVEVRVDTTKVTSRADLLLALYNIEAQILKQDYPAA